MSRFFEIGDGIGMRAGEKPRVVGEVVDSGGDDRVEHRVGVDQRGQEGGTIGIADGGGESGLRKPFGEIERQIAARSVTTVPSWTIAGTFLCGWMAR